MEIPRFWARTKGDATDPSGKKYAFSIWGWSQEGVTDALSVAERRLREVAGRLTRGEAGDAYFYGRQPLREEILRTLGESGGGNEAVVTRNRYGAEVLNTSRLPFVDIDSPPGGASSGFFGFFKKDKTDPTLTRIREACARHGRSTFRVYRTCAGYRVLAADFPMDPKSQATQDFLASFGSDPAFMKLCRIQGSFRARLTPKPWRVDCPLPPNQYPRDDGKAQAEFESWLKEYERASSTYATCKFLEAIGSSRPSSETRAVVEEHDRVTRADSDLPLA
jgi:hypothetical protein